MAANVTRFHTSKEASQIALAQLDRIPATVLHGRAWAALRNRIQAQQAIRLYQDQQGWLISDCGKIQRIEDYAAQFAQ